MKAFYIDNFLTPTKFKVIKLKGELDKDLDDDKYFNF